VEDTAYYRYNRFIALNEVGADPGQFGLEIAEFHSAQQARQHQAATGMTTLSTHDTKRGEDVRARLAALAEIPAEWHDVARELMAAVPIPNPAFGYLLWQTFAGVGFIERERMHAYVEKAMREASQDTNWIDPVVEFEDAVHAAVDAAYDKPDVRASLQEFLTRIQPAAWSNSLSQKLVLLTMPGVPDTYQGTELWEDSLVDPDNRRPVDYAVRRSLLTELDAAGTAPVVDASGAAKLWVVSRALRLRRARRELFTSYEPLIATGPAADHVLAFDRGGAITVATRRPIGLAERGGFGDTSLELPGSHVDLLSGRDFSGRVRVADLLATLPVALLTRG
jgi:(1->4)-alpha-D-glucan 1-alpha-D-glucosylmutase